MKKSIFGLPQKVEHCKKCLMTNQKPFSVNETKNFKRFKKTALRFKNGICSACQYSDSKNDGQIDWNQREDLLKELLDKHRKSDGEVMTV